jgi:hypothetical protein
MNRNIYTVKSAIAKIKRNTVWQINEYFSYMQVLIGTAGNGTLGAISFLNNYTRFRVTIVRKIN